MKVYKIRNKEGLYSTGGLSPRWSSVGKTWVALQHINSHLNMIMKHYQHRNKDGINRWITQPYIGCTVIEYITQENAIGICSDEGKIYM